MHLAAMIGWERLPQFRSAYQGGLHRVTLKWTVCQWVHGNGYGTVRPRQQSITE